jgi:hypothetical protein
MRIVTIREVETVHPSVADQIHRRARYWIDAGIPRAVAEDQAFFEFERACAAAFGAAPAARCAAAKLLGVSLWTLSNYSRRAERRLRYWQLRGEEGPLAPIEEYLERPIGLDFIFFALARHIVKIPRRRDWLYVSRRRTRSNDLLQANGECAS